MIPFFDTIFQQYNEGDVLENETKYTAYVKDLQDSGVNFAPGNTFAGAFHESEKFYRFIAIGNGPHVADTLILETKDQSSYALLLPPELEEKHGLKSLELQFEENILMFLNQINPGA